MFFALLPMNNLEKHILQEDMMKNEKEKILIEFQQQEIQLKKEIKNNRKEKEKQRETKEREFLWDAEKYYDEIFSEPWAHDLFIFLDENPQRLENLWGKVITEILLTTDKEYWWFHWFRGVLQMIKSREDILLPKEIWPQSTKKEKTQRKKDREKIIKEYESFLKYILSLDKKWDKNFDATFIAVASQNYNKKTEKKEWDEMIETYTWGQDWNGSFQWVKEGLLPSLEKLTTGKVYDFSDDYNEDGTVKEGETSLHLIEAVKEYSQKHPEEKILIYLWYHWWTSWISWPFTKEDLLELANISSNIHIIMDTCNFGYMFNNIPGTENYINNIQASISWNSNKHDWYSSSSKTFVDVLSMLDIWIHEAELLVRMLYTEALAPLTQKREYINRITWEKETKNIWVAMKEDNWTYNTIT